MINRRESNIVVIDMYGFLRWLPDETVSLVTRIRIDSSLGEDRKAGITAGKVFARIRRARQQINPTLSEFDLLASMEEVIFFGPETGGGSLRRSLTDGVGPNLRSVRTEKSIVENMAHSI